MRDIISVKDFGAAGDGITIDTTAIYAAVAAAAGKTLYFPKGTYLTDRIIPVADTFIFLEPGVNIVAISGGSRCFQIQQPDVHIWGYGAKTTMDGSQSSHNIYILQGADRCSVRGLWADGSGGGGDDCFYIGGNPAANNVSKNISIIDCKGTNPGRNVISVVAVHGCLIEGCDLSGAVTNSPQAGIDVEANLYMANGQSAIMQCVIRRNRVYNNDNTGIIVVFGSEVIIEENEVFNNAGGGIASAAGGTQFDDPVYRTGDRLGVSNFDLATGFMTVTSGTAGVDRLTDDLGINVGMWLVKQTASGAVWPANVTDTRYQIVDIDATQSKIKIGVAFGWQEVSSFPDAGSGTLSINPVLAARGWGVYGREGNNDNIIVRNNFVHDNTGGQGAISMGTSARVLVEGNIVRGSTTGISANYNYDLVVKDNSVTADGVTTTQRGINLSTSNFVRTDGNTVVGFPLQGLVAAGSYGVSLGRDFIRNCGTNASRAVEVSGLLYGEVRSVCYNDNNHPSTYGIYLNNCSYVVVNNAVARNSGTNNANSLFSTGTGSATNKFINCIQYDGSFRP
jgi:parallel beta-helix repeat protein